MADLVGCSVGLVAQSPGWKANQIRLADARKQGNDPVALPLTDYLSPAGDSQRAQKHAYRRQQEGVDAAIDARQKELYQLIGDYKQSHPDASPEEIARDVGCTAGDVVRREAMLQRLSTEQAADATEDEDRLPRESEDRPRRGNVRKQV